MPRTVLRRLRPTRADRSLSALVGLLVLYMFVAAPLSEMQVLNRHFADALFVVMLASGMWVVARRSMPARVFVTLAVLAVGVRVLNIWLPDASLRLWDALFAGSAFALLACLVVLHVLRDDSVSLHEILGAIAGFLLIALSFTQAYRLVAMSTPAAFLWLGNPATYDEIVTKLPYFSFVTLSTLGYGDIVPAHPIARSIANLEAFIGIFYPAILIAHLVSLEVDNIRSAPLSDTKETSRHA
jgi:Ion channel